MAGEYQKHPDKRMERIRLKRKKRLIRRTVIIIELIILILLGILVYSLKDFEGVKIVGYELEQSVEDRAA